ncbi:MAG: alpha/beta fold hydrolase [Myxococcota bacterium]
MRASIFAACVLLAGCLTAPPTKSQGPGTVPDAPEQAAAVELAWPGVPVASAYPVGETRAFEFTQGGRRIGRSWGRYVGALEVDPSHHRFETRIELELPGRDPLRSAGELVLDADGAVVSGFERSNAAELTFRRVEDTLEISDGRTTESVGYAPEERPTGVMAHSAILHEELLLRLRPLEVGTTQLQLLSLSGGIPAQWTGDIRRNGDVVVVQTNLGERITLRGGAIETIEVEASDLTISTVQEPWPTWEIVGPTRLRYAVPEGATFEIRPVEIPGRKDSPTLAGEVLLPKDASGPAPAVLWVGSTGREDRHGFAGPPPVDLGSHEITDALANAGFAVMRFDERGQGGSEPGPLSFVGQVDDAKRALGMLLVQPEVDPDRVLLVGHGDGGLRVLALASANGRGLAGVALLASPGRPYKEVFAQQAAAALAELPPELRAGAQAQQEAMVKAVERGGEMPPELEGEAQWLREMFAVRPATFIGRLKVPLWVGQGGKDFEVDPKADPKALRRAARANKLEVTVHRYPDLDHLFKPEPGESRPGNYLAPGRHVDPQFLTDLVSWASARVGL